MTEYYLAAVLSGCQVMHLLRFWPHLAGDSLADWWSFYLVASREKWQGNVV